MKNKLFFFCFLTLFSIPLSAGPAEEPGFRAALTQQPSFRQAKGEVRWDKQPESYLALGKAYYYGRGIKKDTRKARNYLQKAAQEGQREARLLLALLDIDSSQTDLRQTAGFQTVLQLAQEDYPLAQYALSLLYADGLGATADSQAALAWLKRAAQAPTPIPAAQSRLGLYYALGYPPYLEIDEQKAFSLLLAAAEAEDFQACYHAAHMYLDGAGTEKNEKRAFHFMRLAAKNGLPQAQIALSHMYREGIGVKSDDYGAFHWMHQAAVKGNCYAQEQTALYHLQGIGGPVNRREALFWAVQARANGSTQADDIIQKIKEP